jgi:hypothetical protein
VGIGDKMEDRNFDDLIREDVQKQIIFQIHKCFKTYGIEGSLEKIESIYATMPHLKELWLTEFWKIIHEK